MICRGGGDCGEATGSTLRRQEVDEEAVIAERRPRALDLGLDFFLNGWKKMRKKNMGLLIFFSGFFS